MPYYIDKSGNAHYHEPPGTERQWLPRDPVTGMLNDMSLAQYKRGEWPKDLEITNRTRRLGSRR